MAQMRSVLLWTVTLKFLVWYGIGLKEARLFRRFTLRKLHRSNMDGRPEIDLNPLSQYIAWAGARNREPILEVFKDLFPERGSVLELASGSGMHINFFASRFKDLYFQPSDFDEAVFGSIKQKRAEYGNGNVGDPINIDLMKPETWPSPVDRLYDVIFAVNLLQVAPIGIAYGIARIAAKLLKETGCLAIYGPFKLDGQYTALSNEQFDREILGARAPEWGLKDVRDLEKAANDHGLRIKKLLDLPADNIMLIFRNAAARPAKIPASAS
jgi:hypothetical protein